METDTRYGVVIVTYNRLELLKECIAACLSQTKPLSKIIVINNHSDDGTEEYLNTCYGEDSRFLIQHQEENLGGAGGFKIGIDLAGKQDFDWLLIIDDDAIIEKDYIEQCNKYLHRHPEVKACSGSVYVDGNIHLIHRRRVVNRLLYLEANSPLSGYAHTSFRYDLSTFCGLMVDMEVLREIGLPKAEYFIWYDDTEFSMRLKPYGKIVNINAAKLNHKTKLPEDGNSGFFSRMTWRTYYGHRNRLDAAKEHLGKATYLIFILETIVFILCGYAMTLMPKHHRQGRFITRMLKDALRDGRKGNLGMNEKYLFNK